LTVASFDAVGGPIPRRTAEEILTSQNARGLQGPKLWSASPTVRLAEDEVLGVLVGRGEPALAQESRHHGGGEHDLAPGGVGLQGLRGAMPGELLADAEHAGVCEP
jgi:hypothetical protein